MKIFNFNDKVSVVCESQGTRYGFRHLAYLMINGNEVDKAKMCYYNRTWENFEFQSVLLELIHKTDQLTEEEKTKFKQEIE